MAERTLTAPGGGFIAPDALMPAAPTPIPLVFLEMAAINYDEAQRSADGWRELRDKRALECLDQGFTWRQIAACAHFSNPHLAHLKKKRAAQ